MSASCALRQAVFSLLVFAATVVSASAQGVGAIAGTVTDASGAVLPGATVTLTSAQGTVGGNREVTTDDRGAYQFLRLVMEFAYDVINTGKTNPKVAALLDRVRMIVMPVVNVDGWVRFRRANCGGAVAPPNTCNTTGVDMNRNYPFGWGSNVNGSSTFANRGARPGLRARGPEHDGHRARTTRSSRWSRCTRTRTRSSTRAWRSRPASRPTSTSSAACRVAMANATNNGYTNVRDSAHDYETSGETIDWSYYATRGFAVTPETVGGSCTSTTDYPNRAGAVPVLRQRCTTPDYTGTLAPHGDRGA